MRFEIDQSGKIEETRKPTVLAFCNSKQGAVIIVSREKKLIQKFFRQINKPRLFAYLGFTALIYLLIKDHIRNRDQIIIDREYPGFEKFIKQKLKEIINENKRLKDLEISISQIDKKSQAHIIAYDGLAKRSKIKIRTVLARDVIRVIKKNLSHLSKDKSKSGSA